MPLFNGQVTVTGVTQTIPGTETAAVITATAEPDLDFSTVNYEATINIDGGSDQPILLEDEFDDIDDLVAELNSQTTDATWYYNEYNYLTLTSDTAGAASEVQFSHDVAATEIYMEDQDEFGSDGETNTTPLQLFISTKGDMSIPQQILVQNNEDALDPDAPHLYLGGSMVTPETGLDVTPGAVVPVPLEVGESVWVCAADGESVDVRYVFTRY